MSQTKFIKNPAGIPCNEKNSEELQENIRKWKSIRKENAPKHEETMKYWETARLCNTL